jgi:hypothetical protein
MYPAIETAERNPVVNRPWARETAKRIVLPV